MSSNTDEEEDVSPKIKFISPDDKVVSEVNPFLVSVTQNAIKPMQKSSNLIATIKFNLPKKAVQCLLQGNHNQETCLKTSSELVQDEDGDLVLPRVEECNQERSIFIEYENATTLDLVGLQIWRGAFLLSDFVVHNASKFHDKNLLELGSGTGLVGIVGSLFAKCVFLTDLNEPSIMDLLRANISHNKAMIGLNIPSVLPLDFMSNNWSQELTDAISSSDIVVAADVIYHVEITNAFIRTLKKILQSPKDIFIALEKRFIFTLADMDSVAPMHNHFLEELDTQLGISPGCLPKCLDDGKVPSMEISMSSVPTDFKQYFNYDRCKELVLYHIMSRKITSR